MKYKSEMFRNAKRGTKGRRACRNLLDAHVARAIIKSQDVAHNMKFLSRSQKEGVLLRSLVRK